MWNKNEYDEYLSFAARKVSEYNIENVAPEDVVQEVYIKITQNPKPINKAYVYVSIKNFVKDLARKQKVEKKIIAPMRVIDKDSGDVEDIRNMADSKKDEFEEIMQKMDGNEHESEIMERFKEIRKNLDIFLKYFETEGKSTPLQCDYYSIFLFYISLVLAVRLKQANEGETTAIGLVARSYIVWNPEDEKRSFQSGYPPISMLWQTCMTRLEQENSKHISPYDIISMSLEEISNGQITITRDRWDKWVQRAKEFAMKKIDEKSWNKYFYHFFHYKEKKE